MSRINCFERRGDSSVQIYTGIIRLKWESLWFRFHDPTSARIGRVYDEKDRSNLCL